MNNKVPYLLTYTWLQYLKGKKISQTIIITGEIIESELSSISPNWAHQHANSTRELEKKTDKTSAKWGREVANRHQASRLGGSSSAMGQVAALGP